MTPVEVSAIWEAMFLSKMSPLEQRVAQLKLGLPDTLRDAPVEVCSALPGSGSGSVLFYLGKPVNAVFSGNVLFFLGQHVNAAFS